VSAPTGSGKTLAFVLPIVNALKARLDTKIRALVVLPVQELARQVFDVFRQYAAGTDLKVFLLQGQTPFQQEQHLLVRRGH
jgi:ATP-dependent RNA helicase DDX51/DBP6